jgi:hypothetical protein
VQRRHFTALRSNVRDALTRTAMPPRCGAWCAPLLLVVEVVLLVALPLCGGLLNHIRGGWTPPGETPLPVVQPDGVFTHLLVERLVWALPTGAVVFLAAARRRGVVPALVPALAVALWSLLSLYVGWGTYLAVGRNPQSYFARPGVFDWLVGKGSDVFDLDRRWAREACAMSLRGMTQTLVPGLVLLAYGFGPSYLLSGSLMGFIYTLANAVSEPGGGRESSQPEFAPGTPLAEVLWGAWTWLVLAASCLALKVPVPRVAAALPPGGAENVGAAVSGGKQVWCACIRPCIRRLPRAPTSSTSASASSYGRLPDGDEMDGVEAANAGWGRGRFGALNTLSSLNSAPGLETLRSMLQSLPLPTAEDDKKGSGIQDGALPPNEQPTSASSRGDRPRRPPPSLAGTARLALNMWIAIYTGVLLASSYYYDGIEQSDQRDKAQGVLGLWATSVPAALLFFLSLVGRMAVLKTAEANRVDVETARDAVAERFCCCCAYCPRKTAWCRRQRRSGDNGRREGEGEGEEEDDGRMDEEAWDRRLASLLADDALSKPRQEEEGEAGGGTGSVKGDPRGAAWIRLLDEEAARDAGWRPGPMSGAAVFVAPFAQLLLLVDAVSVAASVMMVLLVVFPDGMADTIRGGPMPVIRPPH